MKENLREKVMAIIENNDYNNLPYEERLKISQYMSKQQILTLWQVLNNEQLKDYRCPAMEKYLKTWLENCVRTYRTENDPLR